MTNLEWLVVSPAKYRNKSESENLKLNIACTISVSTETCAPSFRSVCDAPDLMESLETCEPELRLRRGHEGVTILVGGVCRDGIRLVPRPWNCMDKG